MKYLITFFIFCGLALSLKAQTQPTVTTDLLEEDIRTIEAISLYPDSLRRIIMEAAGHPEGLIRIEEMQQRTQEQFQQIIAPFQQDVQEGFYELARYPSLIESLVVGGKKSKKEIRNILINYPNEVSDYALALGAKRYQELKEIHQIYQTADRAFAKLMALYPANLRQNFEALVEMPEVLDILMDQFRSTVMLGAMYKREPEWIWQVTDSIQLVVAQKRAEELADWKAQLDENPESKAELEAAAQDFVRENGYDTEAYNTHPERYTPYWLYQNYTPYSYWFGYPHWYYRPFWYPHAYWYHWGFYYGPDRTLVIFDFPSWYYMDWYFYYDHHHYYYPHLTHTYLRYTERHRNSSSAATRLVNEWRTDNRNTYTKDWLRDDDQRVERIRSYGTREYQRQQMPTRTSSPTRNPVYVPPSRTPSQPSRTYRAPEAPRPTVKPNRTYQRPSTPVRVKPSTPVRVKPSTPVRVKTSATPGRRPQLDQAKRNHAETVQKRRP